MTDAAKMSEAEVLRGAMARYHQDPEFHALVDTAVQVVVTQPAWIPRRDLAASVAAVALVLDDHRRREQAGRLSTRHPLEQGFGGPA